MVNKCCVPGCASNYKRQSDSDSEKHYIRSFLFPKDLELCEKWKKKIPRENLIVTQHTVVCERHFEEHSIIRFDIVPGKDGNPDVKVARKRVKLKEGAIPTIFPDLPSYLTTSAGPSRESPEKKKRRIRAREEALFQNFLENDRIVSFESLKEKVHDFLKSCDISLDIRKDCIYLFKLDCSDDLRGPYISFSVKIFCDLSVNVWKDNVPLNSKTLSWIITNCKLERWSQLENIISHYNTAEGEISQECLFAKAVRLFEKVSEKVDEECKLLIEFLIEQLKLTQVTPSRRRYSSQCIIFAFCLYFTSPSAYGKVRDSFLILPSIRYLRQLCQNVSCEKGFVDTSFLKKEINYFTEKDLIVNLLIDEIHVKPKLGYRGEKLIGQACNDVESLANSIQCFMISSVMSSNKIIVGMLPVKCMDSEYLLNATKNVVVNCSNAGFNIVSIISDNNRVNRKMFSLFTSGTESKLFINNPVNKDQQIFLLFDSVHLLKSIRNNWLNLKNQSLIFSFPEFHEIEDKKINRASFSDLRTLFKLENDKLLKEAPALSLKALYPHSLERQKVSLALKIFHEANIAALKTLRPEDDGFISWEGTVRFLEIICRWWEIVNVRHPYYGRNKLKPHATPFSSTEDPRLVWLIEMSEWLDKWSAYSKNSDEGFLSNDTYYALKHTLNGLVLLIKYLLSSVKMKFVLPGKFQTDNLEARFGQYRQLSGGNTLVSVEEALASERKLRVGALLKIHSSSKGAIPVREFLTEFSSETISGFDSSFVADFPYDKIHIENESLNVVVYVAGYVARKTLTKIDCVECCKAIGDKHKALEVSVDTDVLDYFDYLNRGGLIYPSPVLVNVLQFALSIMNVTVSSLEDKFLSLKNQKKTLIQINLHSWPESEFSSDVYTKCLTCGNGRESVFIKCLEPFVNVLLNNYSKKLTEASHFFNVKKKVQKFK